MSTDVAVLIFGSSDGGAGDDDDRDEGSEGTRFISIGLCDLAADESRTAPHRVAVDEDDEELPPHSVDVDEEDDEMVDSRSLLAEFGRFKLKLEILEVILSLFTELGRDRRFLLPEPLPVLPRIMFDKSVPLPPLVVRSSS